MLIRWNTRKERPMRSRLQRRCLLRLSGSGAPPQLHQAWCRWNPHTHILHDNRQHAKNIPRYRNSTNSSSPSTVTSSSLMTRVSFSTVGFINIPASTRLLAISTLLCADTAHSSPTISFISAAGDLSRACCSWITHTMVRAVMPSSSWAVVLSKAGRLHLCLKGSCRSA